MNAETLEALKGSIAKWEAIVNKTAGDEGIVNCPLCQIFISNSCKGCPVREKTGHSHCVDTPYSGEWSNLLGPMSMFSNKIEYATTPALVEAAKHELEFLKSLLPRG